MHALRIKLSLHTLAVCFAMALGFGYSPRATAMYCEPTGFWPTDTFFCEGYPLYQSPYSFWAAYGMTLVPPPFGNPHLPIRYVKCKTPWYNERWVKWQAYFQQGGVWFPYPPDYGYFNQACGIST